MFHRDQEIFYTGIVESISDPEKLGRVRVRVHGLHTFDKVVLPTEDLHWSVPIQSVTSAANSGIGFAPTGMLNGTTVLVVFIDGENKQIPLVLGTIAGIPTARGNSQLGFSDPDNVYPLENSLLRPEIPSVSSNDTIPEIVQDDIDDRETDIFSGLTSTWEEPESSYGAEYPKNHAYYSESGHLQEFDDTPGKERINTRHRTGTKIEYLPDGSMLKRIKENNYEIVYGNDRIYIKGNSQLTVEGNIQILCKSSAELVVDGNLSMKVKGNFAQSVDGTFVQTTKGNMIIHADGELILKGSQIHENTPGKVTPNDLVPTLDITALDETYQPDEPETSVNISPESLNKIAIRSDAEIPAPVGNADLTPAENENVEEIPPSCSDIPKDWDYSTRLTSNFTIGSFTKNAVFPHNIVAQRGLSELEIICNLKNLAENVVEKLVNRYGRNKLQINSGFRAGNGRSQHEIGQAVDIHFRGWNIDDYMNAMRWIKDNIKFDQMILEKSRQEWLHISYKSTGNRSQILTRTAINTYRPGIIRIV